VIIQLTGELVMKIKCLGHSLIEVIVVLLLIAITLSAMVSTNLTATKLTSNALALSEMISVADSIASTMRNNSQELTIINSRYLATLTPKYMPTFVCQPSKRCQHQQQALRDLDNVKTKFDTLFINYRMVICHDLTPRDGKYDGSDGCDKLYKNPIVIKIWWPKKGSKNQYQHYYTSVSL
jgi:type IV pilus modification protein PilV